MNVFTNLHLHNDSVFNVYLNESLGYLAIKFGISIFKIIITSAIHILKYVFFVLKIKINFKLWWPIQASRMSN